MGKGESTGLLVQTDVHQADPAKHIREGDLLDQGQVIQQSLFVIEQVIEGDECEGEKSHPKEASPPEFIQADKSTGERYQPQQCRNIDQYIVKPGKKKSAGKHGSNPGKLEDEPGNFAEWGILRKDDPETHEGYT